MKKTKNETSQPKSSRRREVIKKGAYAVPAVLTLAVTPSFSSAASGTGGPQEGGGAVLLNQVDHYPILNGDTGKTRKK